MFERYQAGEQAILVHIDFPDENTSEDLQEFEMLVSSAGVEALDKVTGKRQAPHAKYFVGTGKVQEVAEAVRLHDANVVLFNHSLSPSQEKNIEALCQCRVVDRTTLILDIFAQRARTHEGKLQVELAQLRHISTRLIRGWTHLERQKGGIGLRGPGETQLETDRRLLHERMVIIRKRLDKVAKQRQQGRRARERAEIPTISLVGYTNAGKSTLFNAITQANVYAADQLFATLDPTLRKMNVEDVGTVILADTVGFIRHLPHDLVAAFKATLTETREAQLLLHVIDISDARRNENIEQVDEVLKEISADQVPQLLICNKIDCLEDIEPKIDRDEYGVPIRVWLSARQGIGISHLLQALTERLGKTVVKHLLCLPPSAGKLRGQLYQLNCISDEKYDEQGNCLIDITLPVRDWDRIIKHDKSAIESFIQS